MLTLPKLPEGTYVAIIILTVIVVLSCTTYYYHNKYIKEQTENTLLSSKNRELLSNIEVTNASLEKLAKESLDRETNAKKALEASEKKNKQLMKQAQEYLTAIPGDVNMCISANILYNKYLGGN